MKTAQDDEVNAGIALADYKVIIHRENEDLANALTNQQERLEELLVLQTKQQIRLTECQAELSTVSDSLYASKAELENSEAQYTENRKAAVEERDIYDYVVSIYEGKVEDRFRFKNDNKGRQLDNINFWVKIEWMKFIWYILIKNDAWAAGYLNPPLPNSFIFRIENFFTKNKIWTRNVMDSFRDTGDWLTDKDLN